MDYFECILTLASPDKIDFFSIEIQFFFSFSCKTCNYYSGGYVRWICSWRSNSGIPHVGFLTAFDQFRRNYTEHNRVLLDPTIGSIEYLNLIKLKKQNVSIVPSHPKGGNKSRFSTENTTSFHTIWRMTLPIRLLYIFLYGIQWWHFFQLYLSILW